MKRHRRSPFTVAVIHGGPGAGGEMAPVARELAPLSATLADFRFFLLENCGHKPWIERQARDAFYRSLRDELP